MQPDLLRNRVGDTIGQCDDWRYVHNRSYEIEDVSDLGSIETKAVALGRITDSSDEAEDIVAFLIEVLRLVGGSNGSLNDVPGRIPSWRESSSCAPSKYRSTRPVIWRA
ncbi:hypothetical protein T190_00560 [Sinorhizobium meliloti CCBAU 01290]|nr:hypothetical protein T190_00560 [Sinorhizobium meliloti CCBAU 01290]